MLQSLNKFTRIFTLSYCDIFPTNFEKANLKKQADTYLGPCQTSMMVFLQAVTQRCSWKKVFLEILQNSQENTCASVSFLVKLQALRS